MMVYGEKGQLEPRRHAELVEDVGKVMLDSLLADGEFLGDVFVGVAGDDRRDDFELAGA